MEKKISDIGCEVIITYTRYKEQKSHKHQLAFFISKS